MLQKQFTILILAFSIICGQSISAQKFERKHINYAFGLSNSQISALKQDSLGYIWVGTQGGGVYRWDGKNLKPLHDSLKYEVVRDVLQTPTGTWVLSVGKIFKVNNQHKVKSYTSDFNSKLDTISKNSDDQFFKIFPVSNQKYLLQSLSGKLILINEKGGLVDETDLDYWYLKSEIYEDSLVFFFDNKVFKISITDNHIQTQQFDDVFVDDQIEGYSNRNTTHIVDGQFWVQREKSMMAYDQNFYFIKEVHLPFSDHIYSIEKWNENIWFSTEEGLFRTIEEGNHLKIISKEMTTQVYRLLKTKEGLWTGTLNGIFHFTAPKLHLLEKETENENINGYFAFDSINGKLWAGSYNSGVHIYDGEELIDKIDFKVEGMNEIRSILQDGDSVWIGTAAGLFKLNLETDQLKKIEDVNSRVISLNKVNNSIAVGTSSQGFWIFNDSEIKHFDHNNGLSEGAIWTMKALGSKIFIGTERGLFTLEEDSIHKFSINKTLNNAPVTAIEKINDSIFAVGYAQYGVIIYDLNQNQILHFFHDSNGLSSSYIYFLKLINEKLWVGSSLGIDIVDYEAPFNVFQLQDVNKLGGAETFMNGIVHYRNKVIASTIAGTVVVPYNILEKKSETLSNFNPIVIERVEPLSFEPVDDFLGLKQQDDKSLEIPFGHGSLKFHFNVAHFGAERLKFIYQLEGYDETISTASDEKFAIYKQLPAGEYTFKVWRSFNNQKVGDPAILSFVITTPFYRTDWFRAITIAFILAVIILFFIIRARTKAARAVETIKIREQAQSELRKEMAIDFHDEMGNHLAKIINLSGVLKMWGLQNEQKNVVNKIENAANSLFVSTKDLIWSLRKENNNLEEVYFNAKDFAENLLDKADINFRTYKNNNAEHIILNPKAARDLSLMIKEALTNVYKHSKAKNVNLNFEISLNNQAEITISDDGCGCLDFGKKTGNGLKNMKQRALRSDFLLDQIASKDSGCEIKIRINHHKKQAHV
ncbi:two-component regulator propeller domain-containing protein [Marivirga tractuosa]|uniref:sensor histidine kinase n=1 Tax=Marivirga tractuosa TaxID=1006 RepID=UPI0035CEBF6D